MKALLSRVRRSPVRSTTDDAYFKDAVRFASVMPHWNWTIFGSGVMQAGSQSPSNARKRAGHRRIRWLFEVPRKGSPLGSRPLPHMAGFSFSRERLFSSGFEQFLQRRGSSARHAGFDDCLESLCPEKTSSDHTKSSEVKVFRFTVVGHSD